MLFSADSDAVSFWHWGPFREESRVVLSARAVMAAAPGRGLQSLLDMPDSRIRAMQAAIAQHAHRLQVRALVCELGRESQHAHRRG